MKRLLPTLNSLPSFEAAARHLSFSKAAEELHVTHGAVSRAIRHLETQLGVQLFERKVRSIVLTPVGATYAAEVRQSLDTLAAATLVLSGQQSSVLNVSTVDSFASNGWCRGFSNSGAPMPISTFGSRPRRSWPIS